MRDPILVFGALRSGTTVFRLMLNAHPALNNPGETDFVFDYLNNRGDGAWSYDLEEMSRDRIFQSYDLEVPDGLDGLALMRSFFQQLGKGDDGQLSLNIHRNIETIAQALPDVRVVHLLRDPRDVARSSIGMGWTGNTYYGVDHWIGTERYWQSAASAFAPGQVLELRYEDVIRDPEGKLEEVCAFIGVDWDPAMLGYHHNTTYAPPDPSLTEQWRRKMSATEIGLIEGKAGDLITARGYALSGHPVRRPGPVESARLWLQNKTGRLSFAVRRYGLYLTVMEKVSRWLRLTPYHRTLRARMNRIINANLK